VARQRLIRDEPALPSRALLVRAMFDAYPDGGLFDRDVLVTDATYNFEIFGYYGLSLWLVSESWPLGRVLAEKCRRAGRVVMFEAEALQSSGLGLVPSGREPTTTPVWVPCTASPSRASASPRLLPKNSSTAS